MQRDEFLGAWREYKIARLYSDPNGWQFLPVVEPPLWFLKRELGVFSGKRQRVIPFQKNSRSLEGTGSLSSVLADLEPKARL